jgi:hypothetical protein
MCPFGPARECAAWWLAAPVSLVSVLGTRTLGAGGDLRFRKTGHSSKSHSKGHMPGGSPGSGVGQVSGPVPGPGNGSGSGFGRASGWGSGSGGPGNPGMGEGARRLHISQEMALSRRGLCSTRRRMIPLRSNSRLLIDASKLGTREPRRTLIWRRKT